MKPGTTDSQTYTVQPGDTLSSISKHFYGNVEDYTRILDANRSQIHDKDVIEIGQELLIPTE
jgi:nucleoid-associated protein YgaU